MEHAIRCTQEKHKQRQTSPSGVATSHEPQQFGEGARVGAMQISACGRFQRAVKLFCCCRNVCRGKVDASTTRPDYKRPRHSRGCLAVTGERMPLCAISRETQAKSSWAYETEDVICIRSNCNIGAWAGTSLWVLGPRGVGVCT